MVFIIIVTSKSEQDLPTNDISIIINKHVTTQSCHVNQIENSSQSGSKMDFITESFASDGVGPFCHVI